MNGIFADSFFFFALVNPRDAAHRKALSFATGYKGLIVSTAWVFTELADGMCLARDRGVYMRISKQFRSDSACVWIPASEQWFELGSALYDRRADKDWSLTDCISFEVMRHYGLTDALTGDQHFVQAGFNALLLNSPNP